MPQPAQKIGRSLASLWSARHGRGRPENDAALSGPGHLPDRRRSRRGFCAQALAVAASVDPSCVAENSLERHVFNMRRNKPLISERIHYAGAAISVRLI